MLQMKEQDKTPEEQLSEVETANLPEKVLCNDYKNDLRTWGKYRCTEQEVTVSFQQKVRKQKE